jgi:uncharacterized membrane protein
MGKISKILKELPILVEDGLISEESAVKIKEYYLSKRKKSQTSIYLISFSILGAVLIGSGIILLLAKNWEDLSRGVRTVISLTPLVIAQVLCLYAISKKDDSLSFREGASTFLMISIGIAISLISQTYHIYGKFERFLLIWMLLSLPLVYILRVTFPAVLYTIGISVWVIYIKDIGQITAPFWLLFLIILPFYYLIYKRTGFSVRFQVLSWTLVLCLCCCLGIILEHKIPGLWIIIYSAFFSSMYLVGSLEYFEKRNILSNPFLAAGSMGTVILSILFTYKFSWEKIGWDYMRKGLRYHELGTVFDYVIAIIFLIAASLLLFYFIRIQKEKTILFGVSYLVALVTFLIVSTSDVVFWGLILFNGYLLTIGIVILINGIKENKLGKINYGMFILALLIVCRFFDSDISFVIRGLSFVLLGLGFITVNIMILKKKRITDEEKF